jgi:abortive infection bacteriophage resistance protein
MTKSTKLLFNKPFKTLDEQLELLKSRGVIIENEKNAKLHLTHINYYHLAVYVKSFQQSDENVCSGTTFDQILRLYQFDKKLRELLLDVLERIEISLKATIAYDVSLTKEDKRFWYADSSHFDLEQKNQEKRNFLMKKIKNCQELYVKQFYERYQSDYLPVWMAFEQFSFGECVKLLSILKDNDQQIIAKRYSMPYGLNLKWLKCLSFLRNICAHHAWLWNRPLTFTIKKQHQNLLNSIRSNSLYAYLIVIQIYLTKINPTSSWRDRLKKLIEEYQIPIQKMGFPKDWYEQLNNLSNS